MVIATAEAPIPKFLAISAMEVPAPAYKTCYLRPDLQHHAPLSPRSKLLTKGYSPNELSGLGGSMHKRTLPLSWH